MGRLFFLFIFLFSTLMPATAAAGDGATASELERGAKTGFSGYFAIQLKGNASYYLLTLTPEAYQASMRTDGRDLRIVDASGNLVPYAFGGSIEKAEEKPTPLLPRPVPWFPLPRGEGGKKAQDGFIIAADGALRSRERQAETEHRGGDIVDLSGLAANSGNNFPRLNGLVIRIGAPAEGTADYIGAVEALASDDLQNWIPVTAAQLLRLDHGGQRLEQERIDLTCLLPARPPRYLQLRWSGAPPIIVGIEAELLMPPDGNQQSQVNRQSQSRSWRENVLGRIEPDGSVSFDTGGVFPADRLRFHLLHANTAAPVELYSRASENDPWRFIGEETLYRLKGSDGSEHETPEIRIARNRDRFWKMTAPSDDTATPTTPYREAKKFRKHFGKMTAASDSRNDSTGNSGKDNGGTGNLELGGAPLLSVGWQPENLTFLARGVPPFLLAVGNAQATDASIPLTQLLAGDKPYLATAQIGAAQPPPANAPTVGSPPPEGQALPPAERMRRFILWGVLLATVALLAFMAWKVAKRLPREGASAEDGRREQDEK
ncbi:MAG: DUF3999 domain-containing protein [Desulfobulbus sp.]|nr:DUF3999 domain-containing protein [Desulfobulbus sp.]